MLFISNKFAAKIQLFFDIRKFFTEKASFVIFILQNVKNQPIFVTFRIDILCNWKFLHIFAPTFITLCKYKTFIVLFFFCLWMNSLNPFNSFNSWTKKKVNPFSLLNLWTINFSPFVAHFCPKNLIIPVLYT